MFYYPLPVFVFFPTVFLHISLFNLFISRVYLSLHWFHHFHSVSLLYLCLFLSPIGFPVFPLCWTDISSSLKLDFLLYNLPASMSEFGSQFDELWTEFWLSTAVTQT